MVMIRRRVIRQPFMKAATKSTSVPVNKMDYVISIQGIELFIFRLQNQLYTAMGVNTRNRIMADINRLKLIGMDLQNAMEL